MAVSKPGTDPARISAAPDVTTLWEANGHVVERPVWGYRLRATVDDSVPAAASSRRVVPAPARFMQLGINYCEPFW